MPNIDFSKFKTYKWVKIEGAQYPDDITDAQIKSAIDAQLATKGLTKTEGDAQISTSATRSPSTRRRSGPPTAWAVARHGAGVRATATDTAAA